jgi:hypothetical protein
VAARKLPVLGQDSPKDKLCQRPSGTSHRASIWSSLRLRSLFSQSRDAAISRDFRTDPSLGAVVFTGNHCPCCCPHRKRAEQPYTTNAWRLTKIRLRVETVVLAAFRDPADYDDHAGGARGVSALCYFVQGAGDCYLENRTVGRRSRLFPPTQAGRQ